MCSQVCHSCTQGEDEDVEITSLLLVCYTYYHVGNFHGQKLNLTELIARGGKACGSFNTKVANLYVRVEVLTSDALARLIYFMLLLWQRVTVFSLPRVASETS